jgi:hypothetical protein
MSRKNYVRSPRVADYPILIAVAVADVSPAYNGRSMLGLLVTAAVHDTAGIVEPKRMACGIDCGSIVRNYTQRNRLSCQGGV